MIYLTWPSRQNFGGKLDPYGIRNAKNARQLVTASNEGMEGEPSGPGKDENHKLDQVVNAKEKVGARPKPKPAH